MMTKKYRCVVYALGLITAAIFSIRSFSPSNISIFSNDPIEEVVQSLIRLKPGFVDRYPFTGLAEISDPILPSDTAFYWQIPRSGGTTLKYVLSNCLDLAQASRASKDHCDVRADQLQICPTLNVGTLVNVDPSDDHGIRRAADMHLVESGMADVIISSRFLHVSSIFDETHKARTFTLIRDPIERSISTFYYLQEAEWERNYDNTFKDMTLLEYANREATSSDWMVRWLTGKNSDPVLTSSDLDFAKRVLRRKFIILLTEEMKTSVKRLIQYMKWDLTDQQKLCVQENVERVRSHNQNVHPKISETSDEYKALRKRNQFDIDLYYYARELFYKQGSLIDQIQEQEKERQQEPSPVK
eukprot:CAMPEP_0197828468 /NCGR_PEP_ID=MMETSP1437-20131217/5020_1 /TAXON_ID=49252 ORGANISM="Eucampia antarctica, Strain CCMP1452" /NCGR_SAMPLE_ID=MMETSP1437 /ASSEMBLY_ACC=CAM_ASM_001096 /LENGTH=356 /DNA_ID=CAMNT_0043429677 /DNA_START=212 /DNA_END=1282 /DNA_ORIENTATION=+